MPKLNKNSAGFSVFEAILIIVIIGLIVVVGIFVWKNNKTNNKPLAVVNNNSNKPAKVTPKPNPYAGWKSYCSTAGDICFKYPADWRLQKNLYSANQGPSPEVDVITSPSGAVKATYSVDQIGGVPDNSQINVLDARPVGQSLQQIALVQNDGDSNYTCSVALVSKSLTEGGTNNPFKAGDVYTDQGSSNVYKFSNGSAFTVDGNFHSSPTLGNSEDTFSSLSDAKNWYNSPDVQTATRILDSVTTYSH